METECIKLFLITTLFFSSVSSYFVTIDGSQEECFFENLSKSTKMTLTFEVVEGGFLDIDAKIIGPDKIEIYSGKRESNGKYTFAAKDHGIYTYCFSNKMSSVTPKIVMFAAELNFKSKLDTSNDISKNISFEETKIETMIRDLSTAIKSAKQEQTFMNIRQLIHMGINANTNSRVLMWALFESLIVAVMSVGQVYYLRRYFEVRRVV